MVQAEAIATLECKLASKFGAALLANAIPCRTISVGTTPSNLYPSNLYTSPPILGLAGKQVCDVGPARLLSAHT